MTISVIIPVYQVEKYILHCLESVLNQTHQELQIILVDDGSLDSSGDICDQYAKRDERIQVIHKANGGLISAWMEGLKHATCEWVCFVDSDDWLDCNAIERMDKIREAYDVDIVCANYSIENDSGSFLESHTVPAGLYDREDIKNNVAPYLINDGKYLSRGIRISRCAKLIRKSLLDGNLKYCNPVLTIGEDMNIMVPVILNAGSLYIMEESYLYHYRVNNHSIMHKMSNDMWNKVDLLHRTIVGILHDLNYDCSSLLQQEMDNYCDLSMMVIAKELKAFSFDKSNLQSLYASAEYANIKNHIDLDRYPRAEKLAAKVVSSTSGMNYYPVKCIAVIGTFISLIKSKLRGLKRLG